MNKQQLRVHKSCKSYIGYQLDTTVITTTHQKFTWHYESIVHWHKAVPLQYRELWTFWCFGVYRKQAVSYIAWQAKTEDQKDIIYNKLINDINFKSAKVKSPYKDFEVPRAKRLAAMPNQSTID